MVIGRVSPGVAAFDQIRRVTTEHECQHPAESTSLASHVPDLLVLQFDFTTATLHVSRALFHYPPTQQFGVAVVETLASAAAHKRSSRAVAFRPPACRQQEKSIGLPSPPRPRYSQFTLVPLCFIAKRWYRYNLVWKLHQLMPDISRQLKILGGEMQQQDSGLDQRIEACERENRKLKRIVLFQGMAAVAFLLIACAGTAQTESKNRTDLVEKITAREIVVVDAQGVVRARMSGDMPDAVMAGGHVSKRGTKAAGFMLYDEEGIERGGYVTMDTGSNAMLSLDSKHQMIAHIVAGPDQEPAAALRLGSAKHAVELRSDLNGSRMSLEKERTVIQQMPAIETLAPETCQKQIEYEKAFPGRAVCRARYTAEACTRCLSAD